MFVFRTEFRTEYKTEYDNKCETKYDTKCESQYETVYDEVCEQKSPPQEEGYGGRQPNSYMKRIVTKRKKEKNCTFQRGGGGLKKSKPVIKLV